MTDQPKSQVTTRRGDEGDTTTLGGERLSKAHPIMACVGDVDELRAQTALVRLEIMTAGPKDSDEIAEFLFWLLHIYFPIGTICSDPLKKRPDVHKYSLSEADIETLEREQLRLEESVTLPHKFIVSASNPLSAKIDVLVTVTRRLERSIANLAEITPGFEAGAVLRFVNRLSDYFYILARYLEHGDHTTVDYDLLRGGD